MFSLITQILAVIVVVTIGLTLVIAVFSYASYKVRRSRAPQAQSEVADFFWRYLPQPGLGMMQNPARPSVADLRAPPLAGYPTEPPPGGRPPFYR